MKIFLNIPPGPFGPYSSVAIAGGFLFISGQIPFDEERGEVIDGTLYEQTLKTLQNLSKVLEKAGSGMEKLLALRVYVTDLSKADEVNRAFKNFLKEPYPSREFIGVSALPAGAMIEIAGIALA